MLRLPDNTIKVLIEGKKRARIEGFHNNEEGYFADISECETLNNDPVAVEATLRTLKNVFEQYVKLNKRIPPELVMSISQLMILLVYTILLLRTLSMKIEEKQAMLDCLDISETRASFEENAR